MQSNGARALVALVGLAVIVAAFFVFSGSDDSDGGDSTAPTVATTTTGDDGDPDDKPEKPEEPAPERVEVVGGQPADGPVDLTYSKGDQVSIVIDSDTATEFHLHGYDLEEAAAPGEPARFEFTADLDGKFELEDHHSLALIAELTVNP